MPRKTINSEAADDFDVPQTAPPATSGAMAPETDAEPSASNPDAISATPVSSVNDDLPESLRESFALLKGAEAQPATTQQDEQLKAARLARIKRHVFDLQQMPVAALDSENMHHAFRHQDAKAKAEKLKVLAREHPEVSELIAENKRLREVRAAPAKK
jgi:hypothetical protein